jgi:hypothetical protein
MILGMTTFTFVHVAISLLGILSGVIVLFGLLAAKQLDGLTALFLLTTVLTSVTGSRSTRATSGSWPAAGAAPT